MNYPIHCYVVITAISLLGLSLLIQGYRLSRRGSHFLGAPSINKALFMTGKLSLFSTWAIMLVKAIDPGMNWLMAAPQMPWTASGFLVPGVIICSISFFQLGESLKVGLPEQETGLKTRGIYSLSRNPLYFGVYLITIASMLYFPSLPNIILGIAGITVHHMITLSEEKFLAKRFGNAYEEYKKKVRRYI